MIRSTHWPRETYRTPEQWVTGLFGHIATWDRELVKVVDRYIASSEKTDYGNDDAVNSYN